MEIRELVALCKSGDERALGLLYKTYSQKMMRICLHYTSSREIAEDLLHDGFIVIFTSIHSLRDPEKLEFWMGRIIKNIALRYINQNNLVTTVRLSELSDDELPEEEDFLSPDFIPYSTLLSMIDRLPEGYGNIFRLSVLEGLSHKEIAALLDIAPHSSSSQLSRAKSLLKKMIADYRMSIILFIGVLIPVFCGYLFRHSKTIEKKVQSVPGRQSIFPSEQSVPSEPVQALIPATPSAPAMPSEEIGCPDVAARLSLLRDSQIAEIPVSVERKDTVNPSSSMQSLVAEVSFPVFSRPSASGHSKWKFMLLGSVGSQLARNLYKWIATPQAEGVASDFPQQVNTWEEYYAYLNARSEAGLSADSLTLMEVAGNNNGDIVEHQRHYAPITLGLSMNKKINDRWSLETGLQYTYLKSTFTTGNQFAIEEMQKLHYIGIPLKVSYRLADYKNFSFYSTVGAQVDIPLKGTLNTYHVTDSISMPMGHRSLGVPWQFSVNGGVGLQYNFSSSVGIYAEPSVHYYIPDGSNIKTIRKEHPVTFSIPVGLRISW
ncbi:sigma-70 family RNA polymerase sigma factor [Phocaeicola sp.]